MERAPLQPSEGPHILFEQFWVRAGPLPLPDTGGGSHFVLTRSVRMHLKNLARAVLCRYPILLQVSPFPV